MQGFQYDPVVLPVHGKGGKSKAKTGKDKSIEEEKPIQGKTSHRHGSVTAQKTIIGIDEASLDIVDQELADYENGRHVAQLVEMKMRQSERPQGPKPDQRRLQEGRNEILAAFFG